MIVGVAMQSNTSAVFVRTVLSPSLDVNPEVRVELANSRRSESSGDSCGLSRNRPARHVGFIDGTSAVHDRWKRLDSYLQVG